MFQLRASQSDARVSKHENTWCAKSFRVWERCAAREGFETSRKLFHQNEHNFDKVKSGVIATLWKWNLSLFLERYSTILAVILLIVLCAWNRDERISETSDPVEAAQCFTTWDKILKSFSLQNNYKALMDDSTTKDSINVINGIK